MVLDSIRFKNTKYTQWLCWNRFRLSTGDVYWSDVYGGLDCIVGLGGAIKPIERRGLLLITSVLLILSVVVELVFFRDMLGGAGFMFGVTKRILLGVLATAIYFYSFRSIDTIYESRGKIG